MCPECLDQYNPQRNKLIKKGIKRECSQGHLEIHGNPEYIAYFRLQNEDKKEYKTGCPGCGGRAVTYDKKHDELFCDSCGLVLSGPPHAIGPGSWVKYPWGNRFDYSDVNATYSPYEEDRIPSI